MVKNKSRKQTIRSFLWVGIGILVCSMYSVSGAYAAWTNLTTTTLTPAQDTSFVKELGDVRQQLVKLIKSGLDAIPQVNTTPSQEHASGQETIPAENQESNAETFSDIATSHYKDAINILVQKGIINTKTAKFYPENHIKRGDAIKMLVGLLQKNPKQPSTTSFTDVWTGSPYAPYVESAYTAGLLDYMITVKDGNRFFSPEKAMTKDEVKSLLEDIPLISLPAEQQYGDAYMTRGEYAQLLVTGLGLLNEPQPDTTASSHLESWLEGSSLLSQAKTFFSNL